MTTKKTMPLTRLHAQMTAIEEKVNALAENILELTTKPSPFHIALENKVNALEALTQALDAVFKTLDGQVSLLEQHRIEDCKREYNQDERIKALEGLIVAQGGMIGKAFGEQIAKDLEARVTLLSAEVDRLANREATVKEQIADLQERVRDLESRARHAADAYYKIVTK